MTINEIVEKFGTLKIDEKRNVTDQIGEFVIFSEDVDQWYNLLSEMFGPAVKAEGEKPSQEDLALTKKYGSIYSSQTLFKKDFDDYAVIAMLWPWGDREHTTLKIAILSQ